MNADTWYDKGYNEGFEAAAKIARQQYALVEMWTDKIAVVQAERDALLARAEQAEAEVTRLRKALVQAEMSFQEAADYAEAEYQTDATIAIIARTGERLAREVQAASAGDGSGSEGARIGR